ncbi:MAG: DUF4358 domain-containing protein [Dorea sp.]|jgi:hypothetical protein|nr:DUF4358 domain-containing protein [Dorea sp.]
MKKSGIDVINILKYTMTLTIFIYVVFLVIAQGADAPMEQVAENVLGMIETDGMEEAGAQDFKRYYGLNAGDYEDVALYLPDDVMGVKELLLVKVKDKSQIETVRSAARRRLDTQTESFEGYGAEQTKLLKAALLENRGSYVFMSVGKDADKAYTAFKKSL